MASAKQIAWRKKFARMSKAGKFKKSITKSTKRNEPFLTAHNITPKQDAFASAIARAIVSSNNVSGRRSADKREESNIYDIVLDILQKQGIK